MEENLKNMLVTEIIRLSSGNPLKAKKAEAYNTQEECEATGKIWKCDIIPGRDEPYCRCLNNT